MSAESSIYRPQILHACFLPNHCLFFCFEPSLSHTNTQLLQLTAGSEGKGQALKKSVSDIKKPSYCGGQRGRPILSRFSTCPEQVSGQPDQNYLQSKYIANTHTDILVHVRIRASRNGDFPECFCAMGMRLLFLTRTNGGTKRKVIEKI